MVVVDPLGIRLVIANRIKRNHKMGMTLLNMILETINFKME